MDEDDNIIGDKFPYDKVSNYEDIVYKHKIKGEKWGCIRVDILKKYKFPHMLGANFFPESYIWSQIGVNYNILYLNIPLRIYHQDAGNQLMKVKIKSIGTLKIENFYAIWWMNNILPKSYKYISYKEKLGLFISIWRTTFRIKKSPLLTIKEIKK